MAVAVDDTIPAEWMHADAVNQVVAFIRSLRIRPTTKRQLLARWALMVGAEIDPELYPYVMGVDFK